MAIKQRNIVVCILLQFVTCGIYGIYWGFKLAKESVSVKDPADSGILEALLLIFFPIVGAFLTEKKFSEGCAARGVEHKDNSIMYLILCIIPCGWLVVFGIMQNALNKLAA